MRDLADRLRQIVRQDHGGSTSAAAPLRRELTYVPDGVPSMDPDAAARLFDGVSAEHSAAGCVAIDTVWEPDHSHGRQAVRSYVPTVTAPLALFDARVGSLPGWADRIVFFDVETTGLSGGAGTLAFLAGCGWFDGDAFRVRQFFLTAPSGEHAMLAALTRIFDEASLLVTFNGRTFDVPLMETRWAFHRRAAATDDVPHFDMLPTARRLWGRRERDRTDSTDSIDDVIGCSLGALERSVLGFHRRDDVPGFEIPARYFHFVRTGNAAAVTGVLEHNRHDLISLAGVMAHALRLAEDGPTVCREPSEQLALGRLYERAADEPRALAAFELASRGDDRDARRHALARLATLLGRGHRHDEAATAWQSVLNLAQPRAALSPLERRATEALAIHHEHRARNLAAAREYAERLSREAAGRARDHAAHRLGRIDRKLGTSGKLI